jgi:kynureninase
MESRILSKSAFLGADRVAYLDAAATSLMPKIVFDAQRDYFQLSCANPHSETHLGSRSTTLAMEEARESVGRLFGAPDGDYATIFVGSGSTAALNRAARVVSRLAVDRRRVVVSAIEHHSNLLPWWDRSGLEVVLVSPREDGSHDYEAIEYALAQSPTSALAASAASNVTGAVADLPLLGTLARRYGAMCVIDAAQAAPHLAIDVSSAGIDFLAISGHKLFVPGSPARSSQSTNEEPVLIQLARTASNTTGVSLPYTAKRWQSVVFWSELAVGVSFVVLLISLVVTAVKALFKKIAYLLWVNTTGSPSVIAIVCSNTEASEPSFVAIVHPSSLSYII